MAPTVNAALARGNIAFLTPTDCSGDHDVMARQVRPWSIQPDTRFDVRSCGQHFYLDAGHDRHATRCVDYLFGGCRVSEQHRTGIESVWVIDHLRHPERFSDPDLRLSDVLLDHPDAGILASVNINPIGCRSWFLPVSGKLLDWLPLASRVGSE